MRLIDQHPHHIQVLGQFAGVIEVLGVDADGMAEAADVHDGAHLGHGVVEVLGPVDGQDKGQFLVGEGMAGAGARILDHEEPGPLRLPFQARLGGEDVGVLGDDLAVEVPVDPKGVLDFLFFIGARKVPAGFLQGGEGVVIDVVEDDHRVFRRARRRVVEDLRHRDLFRRVL